MEEQKAVEQMTVLMVEPGYVPYEKTIPNTLEAKQELVGGLITAIYPYEEMVAIVANDEGILLNMDFNRSVEGGYGRSSRRARIFAASIPTCLPALGGWIPGHTPFPAPTGCGSCMTSSDLAKKRLSGLTCPRTSSAASTSAI